MAIRAPDGANKKVQWHMTGHVCGGVDVSLDADNLPVT